MKFDFEEADNKALQRASNALMHAKSEYERHKGKWGNKDKQTITSWNPAIKEVGENYCNAIVRMHACYFKMMADIEMKAKFTDNMLEYLDEFSDFIEGILDKGVRNETGSRWRTNALVGLLNKANESTDIMVLRLRKAVIEQQRKEPRKSQVRLK